VNVHHVLRPEAELLLRCLRPPRAASRGPQLPESAIDWAWVERAATRHGVAPLLYSRIHGGTAGAPASFLNALRECYRANVVKCMRLAAELAALMSGFAEAGIPVLPLKGPVLALQAYGDLALREFDDLDLLVRKRDADAAVRLLGSRGYTLHSLFTWLPAEKRIAANCELLFVGRDGIHLDLSWEVAPLYFPVHFDAEILWSRLEKARIAQREVPSLSTENLLLFLCVHGAKHAWASLKWICDVAWLLDCSPEIDWQAALSHARRVECERALLLGLALAGELLEAPLPAMVGDAMGRDRDLRPLVARVKHWLFQPGDATPGSLDIALLNIQLTGRIRPRIRYLWGLLRAVTPAEGRLVRLPRPLFFLHYPLRLALQTRRHGLGLLRLLAGKPRG
jgi:hypothetical protein